MICGTQQHRERPGIFHQVITRALSLRRKNLWQTYLLQKRVQMNHWNYTQRWSFSRWYHKWPSSNCALQFTLRK